MHISRKGTCVLGCGEYIYRQKNFKSLESNYRAGHTKHRGQQARTLFIDNTWKRFRHCVTKVFCKHKEEKDHVPYASLTRLDRLSIGEDELKRAQKKVRFCSRRKCSIDNSDNELSVEREDELDRHFDTVLRERASRSRSYTTRRMAICRELERNTEGNNGVSLFELRKTLIINNRFKEMGM